MPQWVKSLVDEWAKAAGITSGRIFRRVSKSGKVSAEGITEKSVWHIVRGCAERVGFAKLAPHDLRRTCTRLCHTAGEVN